MGDIIAFVLIGIVLGFPFLELIGFMILTIASAVANACANVEEIVDTIKKK